MLTEEFAGNTVGNAEVAILVIQLFNIFLFVMWIALAVYALLLLTRSNLSTPMLIIGIALIVLVPILPALAVVITRPDRRGGKALLVDQGSTPGLQSAQPIVREAQRKQKDAGQSHP